MSRKSSNVSWNHKFHRTPSGSLGYQMAQRILDVSQNSKCLQNPKYLVESQISRSISIFFFFFSQNPKSLAEFRRPQRLIACRIPTLYYTTPRFMAAIKAQRKHCLCPFFSPLFRRPRSSLPALASLTDASSLTL